MLFPDEYNALCQMRILDREVFYYLEQRMDRETGVIGRNTRVSYSGIALDISERMSPGRRDALLVFNSKQVENAVERLVAEGLLRRHISNGRDNKLVVVRVFFANYLHEHKSVQKQVGSKLGETRETVGNEEQNKINKLSNDSGDRLGTGFAEVGTTINTIITTNSGDENQVFALSLDWSPSDNDLRAILFRAVGSKHKVDDIDPIWLASFAAYWASNPGRKMTQAQWTARFATDVIRYFRDPAFVAAKFGGGNHQPVKVFESDSKQLPEWARLPKNDDDLVQWSLRHGYGEADQGDGYREFRGKLRRKIDARMKQMNMPKVVH